MIFLGFKNKIKSKLAWNSCTDLFLLTVNYSKDGAEVRTANIFTGVLKLLQGTVYARGPVWKTHAVVVCRGVGMKLGITQEL